MSNEHAKPVARDPGYAAYVAIDWAGQKHVGALQSADCSQIERGELDHTPEAVEAWAGELARRFGGQPLAVCLEQSRGALLYMLTKYEHLTLYPVHSTSLAKYREAFYPSGAKDDPSDAELLLELLVRHRDRLRRLEPDTVEIRTLQFLVEERRKLVDQKTAQSNRLTDRLKLYFPQVLQWFDQVDSAVVGDVLERWPTLEQLQQADPATFRQFLQAHNCRRPKRIQQQWEQIRQAVPATRDPAVVEAGVVSVRILVQLIRTLRRGIAELEEKIQRLAVQQPDFPIFDSLPGAGPALVPRLMVALGSRRERFDSAHQIHCYSGIAPVLERSGKKQWTHFRWQCPKFLRQTFHEWAGHSIRSSPWARAYYQQQRAQGKGHHAAVRALAYKWIRILFRCWKNRTPYNEQTYQQALRQRGSRLLMGSPEPVKELVRVHWKQCGGFWKLCALSS